MFQSAGKKLKKGGSRLLYNIDSHYSCVAVCCLGKQGTGYNEHEGFHEGKENIRGAVAGLLLNTKCLLPCMLM